MSSFFNDVKSGVNNTEPSYIDIHNSLSFIDELSNSCENEKKNIIIFLQLINEHIDYDTKILTYIPHLLISLTNIIKLNAPLNKDGELIIACYLRHLTTGDFYKLYLDSNNFDTIKKIIDPSIIIPIIIFLKRIIELLHKPYLDGDNALLQIQHIIKTFKELLPAYEILQQEMVEKNYTLNMKLNNEYERNYLKLLSQKIDYTTDLTFMWEYIEKLFVSLKDIINRTDFNNLDDINKLNNAFSLLSKSSFYTNYLAEDIPRHAIEKTNNKAIISKIASFLKRITFYLRTGRTGSNTNNTYITHWNDHFDMILNCYSSIEGGYTRHPLRKSFRRTKYKKSCRKHQKFNKCSRRKKYASTIKIMR